MPKEKENRQHRYVTQYGHDVLSKLKGNSEFMGFEANVDNREGYGSITVSGAQLLLFGTEEQAQRWTELEEYLKAVYEPKIDRDLKFPSLTDNLYWHGGLQCFRQPYQGDLGCLTIQRKMNQDFLLLPFVCNFYFQVVSDDPHEKFKLEHFVFFKDNRVPILFTPELVVCKSFDFSAVLQDDRVQEELDEQGFQAEDDQKPPKSTVNGRYGSRNN